MNSSIKPTRNNFHKYVQEAAPQELDPEAATVVYDIWDHWELIYEGLIGGSVEILIDTLFLSKNHPKFGRYNTWKGFGLLLMAASVLLILVGILSSYVWELNIVWQVGLSVLIAGYVFRRIGIHICAKDSKKFRDALIDELSTTPKVGMTVLCLEYLCGDIGLRTDRGGIAFWPVLPSTAFVGA